MCKVTGLTETFLNPRQGGTVSVAGVSFAEHTMRNLAFTLALIAMTGPALAGANFQVKEDGTKSQGSCVGVASSSGTGNGAVVGGNGTIDGKPLPTEGPGSDQTTTPGSRADEVRTIKEECNRTK